MATTQTNVFLRDDDVITCEVGNKFISVDVKNADGHGTPLVVFVDNYHQAVKLFAAASMAVTFCGEADPAAVLAEHAPHDTAAVVS